MIFTTIFMSVPCFAYDASFYGSNDILYYNDSTDDCSSYVSYGSNSSSSITYELPATTGGTGNEAAINTDGSIDAGGFVTFHRLARDIYKVNPDYLNYAINMRWTYASWAWGGGSNIVDSAQSSWMSQAPRMVLVTNPENGKSIYATILESGPAPWTGAAANKYVSDPDKDLWGSGYVIGTPEGYTGRVSGLTPAAIQYLGDGGDIQRYYKGGGPDLVYQWATDQDAKPGPTTDTATSTGKCATSNSNSTIVSKAEEFVYKSGDTEANVKTIYEGKLNTAYVDAVNQYIGNTTNYDFCSIFVSAVMRASGVDPEYPTNTSTQLPYVKEHTDKYEVLDFYGKDASFLQPGDILLVSNGSAHHTSIWLGGDDYKTASASQAGFYPKFYDTSVMAPWFAKYNGSVVVRLKS